jgi:hypothetical protein
MKGQHFISSLLRGGNTVVTAGPVVIKRVGGRDPRRKFFSENLGRALLTQVGIDVVPVLASFRPANVIVMRGARAAHHGQRID